MPNDMKNYMNYHVMGSVSQIRMYPGCVPTKYECQQGTANATEGPIILKRGRKKIVEEYEKHIEERVPPYPSGRTVDVHPTTRKDVLNKIATSDEALDNIGSSSETLSIPEIELKEEIASDEEEDFHQSEHENGTTLIPEAEIKEEITIDDNFTPCMQLVKTEHDPFESKKDQLSHHVVIGHDHNYQAAIPQPFTKPMVPAQESPQPLMLISGVASFQPSTTPQTSFENSYKINKKMAMELQREKALNAKHKKTIEELRLKVKMLNSRMRRRDLLVHKLQTALKIKKFLK